ncbi:MAG: YicC family protein [Alphaproteobacteria bacterium]|nr:YicC family protein [Alphaproteobacteria bacterium]
MTGYARSAGGADGWAWVWELKSVNGRGLDLRFRLPPGFERIEGAARAAAAKGLSRGNVSAVLNVEPPHGGERVRINRAVLDQVLVAARELQSEIDAAAPRIDGLLAIRGVVETGEAAAEDETVIAARDAAILATLDRAVAGLARARNDEGREILASLTAHLEEITDLAGQAARVAAAQPAAIKARIQAQLAELLGPDSGIAPDRLAQEVALMAVRADVREEIDRLGAHVTQARALFTGSGAVGRKLEFLAQEFNREANTLCSKSSDLELTRIGLALKAAIDRLREQSANVE